MLDTGYWMLDAGQIEKGLRRLFAEWAGEPPLRLTPLAPAASSRRYFLMEGGDTRVVGAYGPSVAENLAFCYLSRHLSEKGLPVPFIHAEALLDTPSVYLQEYIGEQSLYDLLPKGEEPHSERCRQVFREVVRQLPRLQVLGAEGLDESRLLSTEGFDEQAMLWDLQYFKYYILKLLDLPFDESALERDFHALSGWLAGAGRGFFMLRDCQSRNILLRGDRPVFIDFQAGRRGPLQYDLVSLLWQAKARLPHELREELVDEYLQVAATLTEIDRPAFRSYYHGFALLRTLQVLAVYGLRGLVEGKAHFLQSIPLALANLAWLLKDPVYPVELPELRRHLQALIEHPRLVDAGRTAGEETPLVVHIGSFSYRKGLPTDRYGHGGGFVFDCRAIHNPGRYEQYRKQTGLDPEVKAYLQQYTQMETFLREVFSLVDRAVDVYLDRDFEHLSVHFGCTGGQHRSVYAAERLARHLREKYGIRVEVEHREAGSW